MELQAAMNTRKSIRAYEQRPVAKAMINELIEAASLAPTWKNTQTGRYHVILSEEMLSKVKAEGLAPFNAVNSKDAPVLIVTSFVKDRSGYERDGTPSNELGNGWGCYDLGLQNEALMLKASECGLSTLVMGIRDADKIRALLSLPEAETIVAVIAVGYGAQDPQRPARKEVEAITTYY